jgi:uncharacterized protein
MPRNKKPDNKSEECVFTFHVVPRSSRISIGPFKQGEYKVKLTAPPVEGAANEQLIRFLSKTIGSAPREIEIISGSSSRTKRVLFRGLTKQKVMELLNI